MSLRSKEFSDWLRALPTLSGDAPSWDLDDLPRDPRALFGAWLRHAVETGVAEAHAATLATVDENGVPDARTLILKDVDERGWAFAGPRTSRKGTQLAVAPVAAMNFWWQPLVRAVRVRGRVVEAGAQDSAADLGRRSSAAREAIAPGEWVLWRLVPERVEFWQGAPDRRHARVVYTRRETEWVLSSGDGAGA